MNNESFVFTIAVLAGIGFVVLLVQRNRRKKEMFKDWEEKHRIRLDL